MEAEQPATIPPAHLYMEDGANIFRVSVGVERLSIGSAEDNDIVVRTPDMDPHHAAIEVSGGHYVLTAVTRNPPVVNGKLVDGPRRLYNGDVVDLAGQVMTFVKVPAASDTVLQLGIWGAGESPYFVLLNRPEFTMGNRGCDILLPDDFVDSPQCTIENFCAGAIFIVPNSEERPTLINDRAISRRSRLNDGDVLKVGTTEVAVRLHARHGLPGPTDLLPLSEVERARIQPASSGGRVDPGQHPPTHRRSVAQILGDEQDGMRPIGDFDPFDDSEEDARYYLPGYEEELRPSSESGRMEESPGDGHTMVIDVDSAGKRKRSRYYLPDTEEDGTGRARGRYDDPAAGRDTRDDVPIAEDEPEDEEDD